MDRPLAPRILLCCGALPHHLALAAQLHAQFGAVALVVEQRVPRPQPFGRRLTQLFDRVAARLFAPGLDAAWAQLMAHYWQHYAQPPVPTLRTASVNSPEVLDFVRQHAPDLIVISGTALVRPPLLGLPLSIGMLNLHTGLSPYIKGGPNCTNWCLAQACPEHIGSTVMWIDAGIDTGEVLCSGRPSLHDAKTLFELHRSVMQHAHALVLQAVGTLVQGGAAAAPRVPQAQLGTGRTFYTREWTWRQRRAAVRAFREGVLQLIAQRPAPAVVPLPPTAPSQ